MPPVSILDAGSNMKNNAFATALLAAVLVAGSTNAAEHDSDHDGVADASDRCPNTAQLKKSGWCRCSDTKGSEKTSLRSRSG